MPFIDFLKSKSFSRTGLSTIKSQGICDKVQTIVVECLSVINLN